MTTIGSRSALRSVLWLVALVALLWATPASAQEEGRDPKVIELEGIDVIGKVEKPEVFYVLARSSVRYEQLTLDQSFIDRIVATARKNPF